ncbi:MAG: heme-binding protein [Prosthecobacter sp.]|uniref:GlcG/HbpS family heme-binding protein n=1 Tax=Prosthecobacter sp. TaxID=1965333 RepID=UPI0019F7AA2B|nr:heme-binding protein [Prosthecobacter sp.]MBE2287728.1 heme-binding protein [Prosthecobacter sp.]
MKTKQVLDLEDARQLTAIAETEARRNGWNVSIAICDDGGNLMFLQRMDNAPPMSAQIAPEKARACVMARKPSKMLEDMVNNGRFAALDLPVMMIEGGEMVVVDGEIVGAIGVSGVKASQDAIVARAAVLAIGASVEL